MPLPKTVRSRPTQKPAKTLESTFISKNPIPEPLDWIDTLAYFALTIAAVGVMCQEPLYGWTSFFCLVSLLIEKKSSVIFSNAFICLVLSLVSIGILYYQMHMGIAPLQSRSLFSILSKKH